MQHSLKGLLKKGNMSPVKRAWPQSQRDWDLLLASFVFLLALGAVGGVLLFRSISLGEIFRVEQKTVSDTSVIDRDLLDKTITSYEDKARNLQEITTHTKVLPDPSI